MKVNAHILIQENNCVTVVQTLYILRFILALNSCDSGGNLPSSLLVQMKSCNQLELEPGLGLSSTKSKFLHSITLSVLVPAQNTLEELCPLVNIALTVHWWANSTSRLRPWEIWWTYKPGSTMEKPEIVIWFRRTHWLSSTLQKVISHLEEGIIWEYVLTTVRTELNWPK